MDYDVGRKVERGLGGIDDERRVLRGSDRLSSRKTELGEVGWRRGDGGNNLYQGRVESTHQEDEILRENRQGNGKSLDEGREDQGYDFRRDSFASLVRRVQLGRSKKINRILRGRLSPRKSSR